MINVPVTVTTYAIDVTVAQNAINVGVSVVTKTIAVTVNYGLSSTQVDTKIQEHREETNAHLSSSISYGDGTVEEVLNSRFLGVDEGSNIEIDDTNPQRPIVAVKASPEFTDTLITPLATEATYTPAVWAYLVGLFTTVPKSVFQHIVKGWTVMQNLAARVYLLEHNLIYSISLTENVSSLVINLPSPEYDVEIEVDYTWDSDAATSATLRVNGVSGSHYVSSSSQSYIGFISYCARYSAKGIYRLTLINGYVFCQTAIEHIYGSTSVQTPASRTMQGYLKIVQSSINTITFDHAINSGSTIIVRRVKRHE